MYFCLIYFLFVVVFFAYEVGCQPTESAGFPVARNSAWNFTLLNPGIGWQNNLYDDNTVLWTANSLSPFGYETNQGEIPPGGFGTAVPSTTKEAWFRLSFEIFSKDLFQSLRGATLRVVSDNSADVYLNGVLVSDEATRGVTHNVPIINGGTAVGWNVQTAVDVNLFAAADAQAVGASNQPHNQLAVRVINPDGNNGAPSSDLYFNLELEIFTVKLCKLPLMLDVCGVCGGDGQFCLAEFEPRQIALHLTKVETEMRVSWITQRRPGKSVVRWGLAPDSLTELSENQASSQHTHSTYTSWWVHNVLLENLEPGTRVYYQVGGPLDTGTGARTAFSAVSHFDVQGHDRAQPRPFCVGVMADQGTSSEAATVMARIAQDVQNRQLDLMLFPGDLAYNDGAVTASPNNKWDVWGRMRTAASVGSVDGAISTSPDVHTLVVRRDGGSQFPWMFATGNHEDSSGDRFRFYRPRLPQPEEGGPNGLWYSVDFERLHVVSLSSEHPYGPGSPQLLWFEQDLKQAAAPENRTHHPWILVMAHRPPFNSNANYGSFMALRNAISPLMDRYQVDFGLFGHEHSYERTLPVDAAGVPDNVTAVDLGSATNPFSGARKPIYAVVGTAGRGLRNRWQQPRPVWSKTRHATVHGYARLCFDGAGALHWKFVASHAGRLGFPADEFYVCQSDTCPGLPKLAAPLPLHSWLWTAQDPALGQPDPQLWRLPVYQPDLAVWTAVNPPPDDDAAAVIGAGADVPLTGPVWFRTSFTVPTAFLDDNTAEFQLRTASRAGCDVFLNGVLLDDEASRSVVQRPPAVTADGDVVRWHRHLEVVPVAVQPGQNTIAVRMLAPATASDSGDPAFQIQLTALLRPDSLAGQARAACEAAQQPLDSVTGLCAGSNGGGGSTIASATGGGGDPGTTANGSGDGGHNPPSTQQAPAGQQPLAPTADGGNPGQPPATDGGSSTALNGLDDGQNSIAVGDEEELNLTAAFTIVVPVLGLCILLLLIVVCALCLMRRNDQAKYRATALQVWNTDVPSAADKKEAGAVVPVSPPHHHHHHNHKKKRHSGRRSGARSTREGSRMLFSPVRTGADGGSSKRSSYGMANTFKSAELAIATADAGTADTELAGVRKSSRKTPSRSATPKPSTEPAQSSPAKLPIVWQSSDSGSSSDESEENDQ